MKMLLLILLLWPFLVKAQLGFTEEQIRSKYTDIKFTSSQTVGKEWTKYGDIPEGSKFICGDGLTWSNTETCFYFNSQNVCVICTLIVSADASTSEGSFINAWITSLNNKLVVNSTTEWTDYGGDKIRHTKLVYTGNTAIFITYYDNK